MIPRFFKARKGIKAIRAVVEYVVDLEKTVNNNHDGINKAKNASIKMFNMPQMDADSAIEFMEETAKQMPSVKKFIEHAVLSWRPDERPSEEDMFKAAEMFLTEMGWGASECVASIHYDKLEKSGFHLHLAINKVFIDPKTDKVKVAYPKWKINDSHKAARKIEATLGFSHDNGNYVICYDENGKKQIVKNPDTNKKKFNHDYEARTGSNSFKSYLSNDIRLQLTPFMKNQCQSWDDLHKELAKYNLKLIPEKSGLKVMNWKSNIKDAESAAAVTIGRYFSKAKLEQKLGKFKESSIRYETNFPVSQYDPEALATKYSEKNMPKTIIDKLKKGADNLNEKGKDTLAKQIAREDLHENFKEDKKNLSGKLSYIRKKATEQHRKLRKNLTFSRKADLYAHLNEALKEGKSESEIKQIKMFHDLETAKIRADLNENIKQDNIKLKAKLKRLRNQSFIDYCRDIEELGNKHEYYEAAILFVDSETCRQNDLFGNCLIYSEPISDFNPIIMSAFTAKSSIFNDLEYSFVKDKGIEFKRDHELVFTDIGNKIKFTKKSGKPDHEAALLLAAERYGSGKIAVGGSDEFKDKICKIAAKHWHIRLADAALQAKVEEYKKQNQQRTKSDQEKELI